MNGWTPIKLLNAAAWMLLPLAALLMSPYCICIALRAGENWLQFGLFDPATGGDPLLSSALASTRVRFILGMPLAAMWLLGRLGRLVVAWRKGASDELHPSGEWVQVAFGLLLAVPFFLLKTAPAPTWTSYTPQGGAGTTHVDGGRRLLAPARPGTALPRHRCLRLPPAPRLEAPQPRSHSPSGRSRSAAGRSDSVQSERASRALHCW